MRNVALAQHSVREVLHIDLASYGRELPGLAKLKGELA
jgi:hypothetical protein